MLIEKLSLLVQSGLIGSGIAGSSQPLESFALCDRMHPGFVMEVDFVGLTGFIIDYRTPIRTCVTEAACISYPIVIAVPPRLPQRAGEQVRWRIGDYRFAIRARPGRAGSYRIEAAELRRSLAGHPVRWARAYYDYDARDGVMSYRRGGSSDIWTRCGGRLTFEDLSALRSRLVPDFRHNPRFFPNLTREVPFRGLGSTRIRTPRRP